MSDLEKMTTVIKKLLDKSYIDPNIKTVYIRYLIEKVPVETVEKIERNFEELLQLSKEMLTYYLVDKKEKMTMRVLFLIMIIYATFVICVEDEEELDSHTGLFDLSFVENVLREKKYIGLSNYKLEQSDQIYVESGWKRLLSERMGSSDQFN